MNSAKHHEGSVPLIEWLKASWQWLSVLLVYVPLVLLGLIVVPLSILTSRKQLNYVGESDEEHSERYKAEGSSGFWEYYASNVPFLRWFSNLEDGDLGEPSGKYSASRDGDERSFASRYNWLALRNPVNMLKRTNPFFHCIVDDCTIEYWGNHDVDDKGFNWGWHFVKATDIETGKSYYGYRSTKKLDEKHCRQWRLGFKVKPHHAKEVQDNDDKDKALTFRVQWKSEID